MSMAALNGRELVTAGSEDSALPVYNGQGDLLVFVGLGAQVHQIDIAGNGVVARTARGLHAIRVL